MKTLLASLPGALVFSGCGPSGALGFVKVGHTYGVEYAVEKTNAPIFITVVADGGHGWFLVTNPTVKDDEARWVNLNDAITIRLQDN